MTSSGFASAYPSGHLVMLLVCLGCLLLLFPGRRGGSGPGSRWSDCSMGVSILVVAMHWLTDVVGSALLGVTVLVCRQPLPRLAPGCPHGGAVMTTLSSDAPTTTPASRAGAA